LTLLPIDELKDIRDKGPFPVEINCHFCHTPYQFTHEDIVAIYAKRYPNN
jgi:molecular chaperone Hsp33